MKCPKCDYLGFDTGNRCKNCGYDFSLIADEAGAGAVIVRDVARDDEVPWLEQLDRALGGAVPPAPAATSPPRVVSPPFASPAPAIDPAFLADVEIQPPPSFRGEPALPLFSRGDDDDRPLITVPSAPRAPLAVRRTPDTPRLRAFAKSMEREPTLTFTPDEEVVAAPAPVSTRRTPARTPPSFVDALPSGVGRRLGAAAVDHAILCAIDAAVVYFTLRIASVSAEPWVGLPLAPLVTFLLLLKVVYFTAFTTIGGQTIGKMGAGIRVVSERSPFVDAGTAVGRTLIGVASIFTLGVAFVPALVGRDRRALHDRVAHTRVVILPAA